MTSYFVAPATSSQAQSIILDHENSDHLWVDIDKVAKSELAFEAYSPEMIDKLKTLMSSGN